MLPNTEMTGALLELTVRNHPGVFAHLANLCSRRAYRIEGLFALPAQHAVERRVWLLLQTGCALEQVERQLLKLEDVRAVRRHEGEHPLLANANPLHSVPL